MFQSDGQTDMTKSIFAFRNSAKARKMTRNGRISLVVEIVDTMCQTFVWFLGVRGRFSGASGMDVTGDWHTARSGWAECEGIL
jgi:hypothetical protein